MFINRDGIISSFLFSSVSDLSGREGEMMLCLVLYFSPFISQFTNTLQLLKSQIESP